MISKQISEREAVFLRGCYTSVLSVADGPTDGRTRARPEGAAGESETIGGLACNSNSR